MRRGARGDGVAEKGRGLGDTGGSQCRERAAAAPDEAGEDQRGRRSGGYSRGRGRIWGGRVTGGARGEQSENRAG